MVVMRDCEAVLVQTSRNDLLSGTDGAYEAVDTDEG